MSEMVDESSVSTKVKETGHVIVEFEGGDDRWDPKNCSSFKK
jgi:hypothetical protein